MRRRTFLAAAGATLAAPRAAVAAPTQAAGEAGILRDAMELEQLAGFVYDHALRSGLVRGELVTLVRGVREHELRHERALGASLEAIGGAAPRPPATPEEADALLERRGVTGRLAQAAGEEALLRLAEELELHEAGAYARAVGQLEDVRLIQTCASILAAEGAHLVVIREALGSEQLPTALEAGRP